MNLRALLELMRVSNLPTVWSNAVMGWVAGLYVAVSIGRGADFQASALWSNSDLMIGLFVLSLAVSLIYSGGMVLNDYVDREIDAKERPARPIPSGRVSAKAARVLGWTFKLVGLGLIVVLGHWRFPETRLPLVSDALAVILVALVAQYNDVHQRYPSAVWLMAACRSLVVLVSATLALGPESVVMHAETRLWILLPAVLILLYTLAISIVARREVDPECGGFGGPKTVMNMIAAMPLLDAVWLVAMGLWPASLVCVACAGLTKLGHRRIAGS